MKPVESLEPRTLLSGVTLSGSPVPITTLPSSRPAFATATLADGKIVIAYPKSNELFAKVLSPDGSLSGEVMLSGLEGTAERFVSPALVASADGMSFFVAYDAVHGPDNADIFLAKYSADLTQLVAPFCVDGATGLVGNQIRPVLALNGGAVGLAYENTPSSFGVNTLMNFGVFDASTGAVISAPAVISPPTEPGEAGGGKLDRSAQLVVVNGAFQCVFLRQTVTASNAFENQSFQLVPVSSAGIPGTPEALYRFGYNGHTLGVPHAIAFDTTFSVIFSETSFDPDSPLNYVASNVLEIHRNGATFTTPAPLLTSDASAQYGVADILEIDRPADRVPFINIYVTAGHHDASTPSGFVPENVRSLLFNPATGQIVSNDYVADVDLDVDVTGTSDGGPGVLIFEPVPGSNVDVVGQPGIVDFPPLFSLPTVTIAPQNPDQAIVEGDGDAVQQVAYVVSLSTPATAVTTVHVATRDPADTTHIATAGADYSAIIETVTFAVGEQTKTVFLGVHGDDITELTESLEIFLSDPGGAFLGTPSSVRVDVNDNDPEPKVTIDTVDAQEPIEGDPGEPGFVTVLLRLDRPSALPVTVHLKTGDPVGASPAATPGVDYVPYDADVMFAPGEVLKSIPIDFTGDLLKEPSEFFSATISEPSGALLGTATSVNLTILDDDTVTPTISIHAVDGVDATEGDPGSAGFKLYTVSLSGPTKVPVVANVTTQQLTDLSASATAISGADFVAISQQLTFEPGGELSMRVRVDFVGDVDHEQDEQFAVKLTVVSGTEPPAVDRLLVTVVDDDPADPEVSIRELDGQSHLEGSAASPGFIEYAVQLSHPSKKTVTVLLKTLDAADSNDGLNAHAGADYVAVNRPLQFAPGQEFKIVRVDLVGDDEFELDESFYLGVSNPVNATISHDLDDVQTPIADDDRMTGGPFLRFNSLDVTRLPKGKTKFTLGIVNAGDAVSLGKTVVTVYAASNVGFGGRVQLATAIANLKLDPGQETTVTLTGTEVVDSNLLKYGKITFSAKLLVKANGQTDENESEEQFDPLPATAGAPIKLLDAATGAPVAAVTVKSGSAALTVNADGGYDLDLAPGTDVAIAPAKGQQLAIDNIRSAGAAKSVKAPLINIAGDIILAGVDSLIIASLRDEHHLTLTGPATSPVTLSLGHVANALLSSTQPIKSLKLLDWLDTDDSPDNITAPSIDAITSTGAFEPGLTISGTVKSMTIGSVLGGSASHLLAAANFGNILAASIRNTNLFAGVSTPTLPTTSADFTSAPSAIAGFTLKSSGFSNTNIAAKSLGPILIAGVDTAGATSFGLAALSYKSFSRDKKTHPIPKTPGTIDQTGPFSATLLAT